MRDSKGRPPSIVPDSASSIRVAMCGTPARMKMLPRRMPGRAGHPVLDQLRALGHPGHPQPAFVDAAARGVIIFEYGAGLGMDDDRHAERVGDGVDRDVVMGGADAAGGEQIIVLGPQRVHRRGDPLDHVRHHPHLVQPDALQVQPAGDLGDVPVLGAAGEDLVADDQQARRPDAFFGQGRSFDTGLRTLPSAAQDSFAFDSPTLYGRR